MIAPGLRSSQYSYYEALRKLTPGTAWLDLGCGHQVFAEWMVREQREVVQNANVVYGLDMDWAGLKAHPDIHNKVFGDVTQLPFPSDSLDLVSANMVAEHLPQPEIALSEIRRVLRPGGRFIFHTPNANGWPTKMATLLPEGLKKRLIWMLERRREEDVFPTHYRINTPGSVQRRAANTGFFVENLTMVSTSAAFALFGPLAWLELMYIRFIRHPRYASLRSNIIAVLRKPVSRA